MSTYWAKRWAVVLVAPFASAGLMGATLRWIEWIADRQGDRGGMSGLMLIAAVVATALAVTWAVGLWQPHRISTGGEG